jgi:hypothetical protein
VYWEVGSSLSIGVADAVAGFWTSARLSLLDELSEVKFRKTENAHLKL